MTEAQWRESTDPQEMLGFLRKSCRLTDRKTRLFAVACCRPFLPLLRDPRVGEALEVAERIADGLADDSERSAARKLAQQAAQVRGVSQHPDAPKWERRAASLAYYALARQVCESGSEWYIQALAVDVLIWHAGGYDACDPRAIRRAVGASQAALLRDIIGHPFRPLPSVSSSLLTANNGLVTQLARFTYEERILPEGRLDNARLAVLADALQEAGFEDEEMLSHLRKPDALHVRGCAVVDALLGLS